MYYIIFNINYFYNFKCNITFAGARLSGGHSLHETSSVLVETVTKSSSVAGSFSSLPKFSSDASKVVSRGAGLSKAFIDQKNTFTVDCSKAGTMTHKHIQTQKH